jgi:hypothetical protein
VEAQMMAPPPPPLPQEPVLVGEQIEPVVCEEAQGVTNRPNQARHLRRQCYRRWTICFECWAEMPRSTMAQLRMLVVVQVVQ